MKEVRITGGGLAGLSLGIALRKRGVPVLVNEALRYPRHRVCGEFISGVGSAVLERLGIDEDLSDALRLSRTRWYRGSTCVLEDSLPEPALGISRWALDSRLAGRLTNLGGRLRTGHREPPGGGKPGTVSAVGRVAARNSRRWIGLKVHLSGVPLERDLEIHLGRGGYAGLSRIESGAVNLCGLFHLEGKLEAKGADLLEAACRASGLEVALSRLQEGTVVEGSFCAVSAMDYGPFSRFPEGFSIGDSWGLIPPFTGNGMSLAFESAAAALEPLLEWSRGLLSWEAAKGIYQDGLESGLHERVLRARWLHLLLLAPGGQSFLSALARRQLLPFHWLYSLTH